MSAWWRNLGSGRRLILAAREGGATVGLLPLVLTRYRGSPLRQLRFMGAPQSDFQDLLAEKGRETECAHRFLEYVGEQRDRWDIADLNDLREATSLPTASLPARIQAELGLHRRCPVIPLAQSWEAQQKSLSKNLRSNLGRRRRQLERAFSAELVTADAATLPSAMEDLFRLHNQRWRRRGARGAFRGDRLKRFHHEVARQFWERGWLRLHLLRLDGQVRAAFYCFQKEDRVYYYLSGFDPEIAKYSPGNVLMAYSIERAIADGATEFDLLRGDETYKYQWRAEDRRTLRLVIGHPSLRSKLARLGHRLERFVEHEGLKIQRRLWGRTASESPPDPRKPPQRSAAA
jgi:CelD/BcsL family acetyltransferase involved in cellulose biosynthesis